uniref:No apical meristem-associated C-terminal domain-containing protein n=1 Tax=Oryza glumipatula TaxID=40148 RepID=A0A0E0AGH6_9ORYZ
MVQNHPIQRLTLPHVSPSSPPRTPSPHARNHAAQRRSLAPSPPGGNRRRSSSAVRTTIAPRAPPYREKSPRRRPPSSPPPIALHRAPIAATPSLSLRSPPQSIPSRDSSSSTPTPNPPPPTPPPPPSTPTPVAVWRTAASLSPSDLEFFSPLPLRRLPAAAASTDIADPVSRRCPSTAEVSSDSVSTGITAAAAAVPPPPKSSRIAGLLQQTALATSSSASASTAADTEPRRQKWINLEKNKFELKRMVEEDKLLRTDTSAMCIEEQEYYQNS